MLNESSLSDNVICKYLLPLSMFPFWFVMVSFTGQNLFSLMYSHLFLLLLPLPEETGKETGSPAPSQILLRPVSKSVMFMFSSRSFRFQGSHLSF